MTDWFPSFRYSSLLPTAQPPESLACFYGRITRQQAELLLVTRHCNQEGLYLLRESVEGSFVLSICHGRQAHHYNIERQPDHTYRIQSGQVFLGPVELLQHHTEHLDGFVTLAQTPLNRPNGSYPFAFQGITTNDLYHKVRLKVMESGIKDTCSIDQAINGPSRLTYCHRVLIDLHLSQPWYHHIIGRRESERRLGQDAFDNDLNDDDGREGSFLVRLRKEDGSYVLSIWANSDAKHYRIESWCQQWRIEGGQCFPTILELIDHYHLRQDGLLTKLRRAVFAPSFTRSRSGTSVALKYFTQCHSPGVVPSLTSAWNGSQSLPSLSSQPGDNPSRCHIDSHRQSPPPMLGSPDSLTTGWSSSQDSSSGGNQQLIMSLDEWTNLFNQDVCDVGRTCRKDWTDFISNCPDDKLPQTPPSFSDLTPVPTGKDVESPIGPHLKINPPLPPPSKPASSQLTSHPSTSPCHGTLHKLSPTASLNCPQVVDALWQEPSCDDSGGLTSSSSSSINSSSDGSGARSASAHNQPASSSLRPIAPSLDNPTTTRLAPNHCPTASFSFKHRGDSVFSNPFAEDADFQFIYDQLDPSLFVIPSDAIRVGEKLGGGNFGCVFRALYTSPSSGQQVPVAVKTLKQFDATNGNNAVLKEARTMSQLKHRNIVRLIGICKADQLMLILELAQLGPLNKYLKKHPHVPVATLLKLIHQVALGMAYLESCNFVHRDLAARNVLLASDQFVKISDFGMSKALNFGSDYYRAESAGKWPLKWYAPECIYYFRFDSKSDVWSYGITLWEVFSYGDRPYHNMKGTQILAMLDQGLRLSRPPSCPQPIYALMQQCWLADAKQRPSFARLVALLQPML